MKSMIIFIVFGCIVLTSAEGYWIKFTANSVKSDLFAPLRANKTMVLINECGKNVTEPLGILEQTYREGQSKNGEKCTWRLRAPDNHIVNVISLIFVMEDEIKPSRSDDFNTSVISLYDGTESVDDHLLTRYFVTPMQKVGYFVESMSSKQDMIVEIKYHDNKDFATQKMLINYEFLDYDKMTELLKTKN